MPRDFPFLLTGFLTFCRPKNPELNLSTKFFLRRNFLGKVTATTTVLYPEHHMGLFPFNVGVYRGLSSADTFPSKFFRRRDIPNGDESSPCPLLSVRCCEAYRRRSQPNRDETKDERRIQIFHFRGTCLNIQLWTLRVWKGRTGPRRIQWNLLTKWNRTKKDY